MNTHCRKIQLRLVELLYEELPEDQAARVQQHLAECKPCREEFELCQRTLQTIDTVTRSRLPQMPTAGLLQRLNREIDSRPEYQRPRQTSRFTLRGLALAAAFLLGVVVAPFLFQWYSNQEARSTMPKAATHPIYGNVTGANPLGRPAEEKSSPSGAPVFPHSRNDQLPAIEAELDRLTEPATLGQRSPRPRGRSGSSHTGSVLSSTPERF